MKKSELAGRLARRSGVSKAQAADQLDTVVHDILRSLRSGKATPMPGLGVLVPGRRLRLRPESNGGKPKQRGHRGSR